MKPEGEARSRAADASVAVEPAPPALEVRHVTATYVEHGQRLVALADLSFSVATGEFVALVGPSGSGKSTLLHIVAGLIAPDQGEVLLNGRPVSANERLGRSAYMHQKDLLLPWRTALANAALALEAAGIHRAEARARAAERFPEFGLDGFQDAYPAQLSGGMRQRVAFLRTVLPQKSLLLLDEPFGALDALTRAEMQLWLLGRWEQDRQSVLLVSHDAEEAVLLADRVIVLSPRPGRVAHVERVSLSRPRQRSQVTTAAFVAHKAAILAAVGLLGPEPDQP